jgi:hypothetical protein
VSVSAATATIAAQSFLLLRRSETPTADLITAAPRP